MEGPTETNNRGKTIGGNRNNIETLNDCIDLCKQTKECESLFAQNSFLRAQLKKEKLKNVWLTSERNIQHQVINQLKKLWCLNQTQPRCILGHGRCNINHLKYN